jgi:hypothetical protein
VARPAVGALAVGRDGSSSWVKWKNLDVSDKSLKEEAAEKIRTDSHLSDEIKKRGLQVFLLDRPSRTNFYKSTRSGMFGSKKYFPGIAKDCDSSSDLAEKLKNKRWSDF